VLRSGQLRPRTVSHITCSRRKLPYLRRCPNLLSCRGARSAHSARRPSPIITSEIGPGSGRLVNLTLSRGRRRGRGIEGHLCTVRRRWCFGSLCEPAGEGRVGRACVREGAERRRSAEDRDCCCDDRTIDHVEIKAFFRFTTSDLEWKCPAFTKAANTTRHKITFLYRIVSWDHTYPRHKRSASQMRRTIQAPSWVKSLRTCARWSTRKSLSDRPSTFHSCQL